MTRSSIELSISAGAYLYACLLLFLLPLKLVFSAFVAAAVHESCHLLALRCCHVPVWGIQIGIAGASIRTAPLPPKQEFFCAAAGPAGSLLCLLMIRPLPLLALCACVQGVFNLLPVYPLDGGRMLRDFCRCFCPNHTNIVCRVADFSVAIALLLIGSIFFFRHGTYLFPAIFTYFLLRYCLIRKTPCKQR